MAQDEDRKMVVLGAVGTDIHNVGITIMAHALEESGFKVFNLRTLVSPKEFIDAAVETNADALWLSHHCGHAEIEVADFREMCDEAGLRDIVIYLGGNLVVGKQDWAETEKKFLNMGFNRVYDVTTNLDDAIADLKKDLKIVRSVS